MLTQASAFQNRLPFAPSELPDKVAVFGYGASGKAAAELALKLGIKVDVYDEKSPDITDADPRIEFHLECGAPDFSSDIELLVVSPGIPEESPLMSKGRLSEIPIIGEFFFAVACVEFPPILSVTGTNGKTTTVEMTNHILNRLGFRSITGGNIGTPMSKLATHGFEGVDFVVAEVSSFQLEHIEKWKVGDLFTAATILNVSSDHLDRYEDLEDYRAVKFRLLSMTRKPILSARLLDNWKRFYQHAPVKPNLFGTLAELGSKPDSTRYEQFRITPSGAILHVPARQYATFDEGGSVKRRSEQHTFHAYPAQRRFRRKRHTEGGSGKPDVSETLTKYATFDEGGSGKRRSEQHTFHAFPALRRFRRKRHTTPIIPAHTLTSPGIHNVENLAASLALIEAAIGKKALHRHIKRGELTKAAREFHLGSHRMEQIREYRGVRFVNDSKATNPDATLAALRTFGDEKNVLIILGGLDKKMDFSPLSLEAPRIKKAYLIGQASKTIHSTISRAIACEFQQDLESATIAAFGEARPGDVVLLSPGCASMDMFKNYEERGRTFAKIANTIQT